MEQRPIIAFLYDFDKTLCTTDMQNYAFIPSLGMKPSEFWPVANNFGSANRMDGILAYMYTMIQEAVHRNRPFTREALVEQGKGVVFYPGVEDWFRRINAFGESQGVQVEHYILSSGLKEIIEGCSISQEFKEIYASEFYYDEAGRPVWPKLAVNFTAKTQFVYRINKGVLDISDNVALNSSQPDNEKRVFFSNMIYIGDGLTDVPCMKIVKMFGGNSVGVYNPAIPKKKKVAEKLLRQHRVNFITPALYTKESRTYNVVCSIIDKIRIDFELARLAKES